MVKDKLSLLKIGKQLRVKKQYMQKGTTMILNKQRSNIADSKISIQTLDLGPIQQRVRQKLMPTASKMFNSDEVKLKQIISDLREEQIDNASLYKHYFKS